MDPYDQREFPTKAQKEDLKVLNEGEYLHVQVP